MNNSSEGQLFENSNMRNIHTRKVVKFLENSHTIEMIDLTINLTKNLKIWIIEEIKEYSSNCVRESFKEFNSEYYHISYMMIHHT